MSRRAVEATAEEIAKEKAEALGIAGKALEAALRELRDYDALRKPAADDPRRAALLARAAERTQSFIVQREAHGFRDPAFVLDFFGVPREVVARIGIRTAAS
jgi:hypothetical protein